MEAGSSSLVVRMKTEMIDSSCKSHITDSKGLLSHNAPNHAERSQHPQVPPAPHPLCVICAMRFSWEFLQTLKLLSHFCVCVKPRLLFFLKRRLTECVSYALASQRAEVSASGDGMCTSLPITHVAQWANTLHRGRNLNICHSGAAKNPQARHVVSRSPSQKCAMSSALCVSHLLSLVHKCLLASSPLPAQPLLPLPFFLGGRRSDIY